MNIRKKAVVLLSGGLDSTTTLHIAKKRGFKVFCLIFDYGQRHRCEVRAALRIAARTGCPHRLVKIRLPWGGSSLLDKSLKIPGKSGALRGGREAVIPSTYVPARNTIFLSFALSFAEAIGAGHIFIGANAVDYSGYPDCRPAYFHAFRRLARLATKRGIEHKEFVIEAPLLYLEKSKIIRQGMKLGAPYELTWSCYRGDRRPCGHCDSCLLRAKGFKEAGVADPLLEK